MFQMFSVGDHVGVTISRLHEARERYTEATSHANFVISGISDVLPAKIAGALILLGRCRGMAFT